MKPTRKLTIATALSATLATALIAGPAMAATSHDNQPPSPGTANGDKSTSCRADWTAAAILYTDILAHHTELVNPADITRNADGTVNKIATGTTTTVDLPDDMANTAFIRKLETRADLNAFMQSRGPREADYTWNDGDFTATKTDDAKNIWTITLNKGLDTNTGTAFQFK